MEIVTLDLTDTEWMSILDPERDGLPACCGNVSALRDIFYMFARDSGRVYSWCMKDYFVAYLHAQDHFEGGWLQHSVVLKAHNQLLNNKEFSEMFNILKDLTHNDPELKNKLTNDQPMGMGA